MKNNNSKKIFEGLISRTKIYLVLIAILLAVICILDLRYFTPSVVLYILILAYTYWSNQKRRIELSDHLQDLTFNIDKLAKNTMVNSPFPLVIAETNGNMIWKSNKFTQEFANIDINNILGDLLKQIKLEIENNEESTEQSIHKELEIGNKIYEILGRYTKSKEEYICTIYFIDETKCVELEKEYHNSQICVGLIMIDNFEEVNQRISDEDKPLLTAQIEKTIYDWASEFQGLVVKAERDTFVCIFEQRYLAELEEKKFNILDTIKELELSDKIQITLSISVSTEGQSNYEKYKSAQAGLDIALGRGGDQTVVRENGKYQFFGGRTQELEKRTKVKARIVSHALQELMQEAKNVMIMGHTNGDIDSMGASMGLYRLAKSLNVEAYIVNNSTGISLENFMEAAKEEKEYQEVIINKAEALSKISAETLLIIVDTHKRSYVEVPELLEETGKIAIIDHHRKSPDFIEEAILTFHEVYASSACELVTEILEYAPKEIELTTIEAEALYAGIMMDTKNFTFKTGVRTFEAAAYLRKCGIDIIRVKKWFQSDLKTYTKISKIIDNAEIINDTIGISIYDENDKDANVICAKAADELLTISDITASFVIGKLGDKVCISGRSIGDINVQIILEKLGGGGHITLAGAQVEGLSIGEVKNLLIEKINEYFEEQQN
ncbi:putative signaling protein consisting of a modified GGDEF domain and a DHH domain protein [Clostridium sp. CAG:508]|jgi:c-di-AMP phosphodiesterase-like protein|nr:DHH family phosphoesterase [Clostridia bacterium]CDC31068.1 putative signaling protein consisting of a modified GGDEF domain and a DHH domain protein [Clostridium sp. CAG:508]